MAIEAGALIVIVGEHPDNGKFYTIGEVRQDGWILTTDNHLFHQQFFDICSPLEPRPRASKIQKTQAKRSTTPNSFLGESESPIFLGENLGQNDHTSEISPRELHKKDDPIVKWFDKGFPQTTLANGEVD